MRKNLSGFTIVELLIVIVVVGILASITVVAYSGVQERARNAARVAAISTWRNILDIYYATNGSFSAIPDATYCLGTDFPNGLDDQPRCRNLDTNDPAVSYLESNNTTLMTELASVSGNFPRGEHGGIDWIAGPYVGIWPTGYYISGIFEGDADDCPSMMTMDWDSGSGVVICGLYWEE